MINLVWWSYISCYTTRPCVGWALKRLATNLMNSNIWKHRLQRRPNRGRGHWRNKTCCISSCTSLITLLTVISEFNNQLEYCLIIVYCSLCAYIKWAKITVLLATPPSSDQTCPCSQIRWLSSSFHAKTMKRSHVWSHAGKSRPFLKTFRHRWHAKQKQAANHRWRNKLLHRVSAVESPAGHRGELTHVRLHEKQDLTVGQTRCWNVSLRRRTLTQRRELPIGNWSWRTWKERSCIRGWQRWTLKWPPCCTPTTDAR